MNESKDLKNNDSLRNHKTKINSVILYLISNAGQVHEDLILQLQDKNEKNFDKILLVKLIL